MNPMVSVIIPCYNCEKYLDETLQSLFSQTYENYEVIVVDDGSASDAVAKICQKYKDKLKYLRQKNQGQAAAKNTGIHNSKGGYLAFLDADDIWLPEKLEKQVSYYEELKKEGRDVGLIYTGIQYIAESGDETNKVLYRTSGNNYAKLKFLDFIGTPSSVIIEKSVLRETGIFDEKMAHRDDYDLWLRIAKKYEIYSLDEFLTKHRNTPNSFSKNVDSVIKSSMYLFKKHFSSDPVFDKIISFHKKDFANRHKIAAYNSLFSKKDAKSFRRFIRKGYRYDKYILSFKTGIYYLLSFLSTNLCIKLRSLKKAKSEDVILDVSELKSLHVSENPLISIIIPCYNGEMYLDETLRSVFSQTYKNYEIIAVDDGSSTDDVANICNRYKNRLKYIRQENRGLSAARNAGIINSRGQYLAFIDHDDIWLPEKLEKQLKRYEELKKERRSVGLIYTGLQLIAENGTEINKVLYKSSGNNYKALMFIDFIGTPSSVLVERSVLNDIGLFDDEIKSCSDWELWLRIAKKYEIYSLDEFLTKNRNVTGSLSKNTEGMIKDLSFVIEKKFSSEANYNKITAYHKKDFANRWKISAYEYLFAEKDGKNFRKGMRNGFKYDKSIFSFKDSIYYLLSFFSSDLCLKIRQIMKKGKQKDIIVDVNKLNF